MPGIIIENIIKSEERIKKHIDTLDIKLSGKIEEIKSEMATKEQLRPILQHIGAYEIRAKNVEDILLKDHKPRIGELEKVIFV